MYSRVSVCAEDHDEEGGRGGRRKIKMKMSRRVGGR
jgi:hypothetical protein